MISNVTQKILLVGVCVIVLAGSSFAAYQTGYNSGVATKAVLVSETQSNAAVPTQGMFTLFGTVEGISGQEIIIKDVRKLAITSNGVATSTSQLGSITILTNDTTSTYRLFRKDPATVKKELDAFMVAKEKSPDATTSAQAPESV